MVIYDQDLNASPFDTTIDRLAPRHRVVDLAATDGHSREALERQHTPHG